MVRLEQCGRRRPERSLPDHDLDRGRLEQPRLDPRTSRSIGGPPVLGLSAAPTSISPNGDGRSDRTTLRLRADALVTGSARILDASGAGLRRWTFANAGSGAWTWDGRDSAGRTVADGRYTFRVWGLDRAGNSSLRDLTVRVDRTIRSLTLSRSSFIPAAGQKARPCRSCSAGRPP